MPLLTSDSAAVTLGKHYVGRTFIYDTELPSQGLMEFQSLAQRAMRLLALGYGDNEKWCVVGDITNHVDAVFTYDATGGDYYSHGDSVRHTNKTPDIPAYFTFANGDAMYFGHKFPLTQLDFTYTPAGGTVGPTWQYWNGTAWTNLSGVTDNTVGFSAASPKSVSWTDPLQNWTKDDMDNIITIVSGTAPEVSIDDKDRFWVRVTIANAQTPSIDTLEHPYSTTELKVLAESPASLNVLVYPGVALVNGRAVYIKDIQTIDMTSYVPGSNSVIACIQLDHDGDLSVISSTAAATPISPEPDKDALKLADIAIATGAGSIVTGNITDARIYKATY